MLIGKIVGSIVSTRKNENLVGSKFMIVQTCAGTGDDKRIVAVDNVGAGIGEIVLVATGSAARIGCGHETAPIDAAIVGIVDSGSGLDDIKA
jgi:ethanolamine utilization protein EutN